MSEKNYRDDLREAIDADVEDRREWYKICTDLQKKRRCERKTTKTYPYPGAPNFQVGLIDELVSRKTSAELSMMLNSKTLCHFLPMSPDGVELAQDAAAAFDWLLRYRMKVRQKLEMVLDSKNEIGMGIVKLSPSQNVIKGLTFPDFIEVSPYDVIVPFESVVDSPPERVCHVLRLTEMELRARAREKGWQNVDELIRRCREQEKGESSRDDNGRHEKYRNRADTMGTLTNPQGLKFYVLWEVYHYRRDDGTLFGVKPDEYTQGSGEARRWVTVMAPDAPDLKVLDFEFSGEEWPFVQFRYENRSGGKWYDTRGVGHLTVDQQVWATVCTNMKAVSLEYFGKPMFAGKVENSANVTFKPGAVLPNGLEPVSMPNIPAQFDYDINQCYAQAEKRIGQAMASLNSADPSKRGDSKTATEVNVRSQQSMAAATDSIERTNDPLQLLFSAIWGDLRTKNLLFPFMTGDEPRQMRAEIYMVDFQIIPAGTAATANPVWHLGQLMQLMPMLLQSPLAKHYEILSYVIATGLDPRLVDRFLVNPAKEMTPDNIPVVQAVGQLMQQMQGITQAVQQIGQAMQQLQPDLAGMKDEVDLTSKQTQANSKALQAVAGAVVKRKAQSDEGMDQAAVRGVPAGGDRAPAGML